MMRWKPYMAMLTFVFCGLIALSQPGPLAIKAAKLADSGDLIGAQKVIDKALETEEAEDAWTWYVKGFIHKEIFVEIEKGSIYSENREEAVSAIKHAKELDSEGRYADDTFKALQFIAKTYFNHALDQYNTLDPEIMSTSEGYFLKFKEVYKAADPLFDITQNTVDYYKGLGQAYEELSTMRSNDEQYINAAIRYYKLALALSPEDYHANYNTATNFYNQAVNRIQKINHQTEIFELLLIQEECVQLFKQSLPYMLKAHKQKPKRKETLKGLMAIYRAMNEYETSDQYKETLADLIRAGELESESNEKRRP